MNTQYTTENEKIAVDDTAREIHVIEREEPRGGRAYAFFKRALDICVAITVILVLWIPMLIIALIIKLESKGPAFFLQERLGVNGTPFVICKFRTMVFDAEKDGPQWAEVNDCRCTVVGRFLRKTRIDELPQVWNILRGDMSLVGPRPERECFYNEFEEYIHGFSNRMAVKPGLTGLAQVNGGYNLLPEEKIVYDMEYIRSRSFGLDLKLIFMTFKLVFTHEGAR